MNEKIIAIEKLYNRSITDVQYEIRSQIFSELKTPTDKTMTQTDRCDLLKIFYKYLDKDQQDDLYKSCPESIRETLELLYGGEE